MDNIEIRNQAQSALNEVAAQHQANADLIETLSRHPQTMIGKAWDWLIRLFSKRGHTLRKVIKEQEMIARAQHAAREKAEKAKNDLQDMFASLNSIITSRPGNMLYEEYRAIRKGQRDQIRRRIKQGILFYKSWEIVPGQTEAKNAIRTFMPYMR